MDSIASFDVIIIQKDMVLEASILLLPDVHSIENAPHAPTQPPIALPPACLQSHSLHSSNTATPRLDENAASPLDSTTAYQNRHQRHTNSLHPRSGPPIR